MNALHDTTLFQLLDALISLRRTPGQGASPNEALQDLGRFAPRARRVATMERRELERVRKELQANPFVRHDTATQVVLSALFYLGGTLGVYAWLNFGLRLPGLDFASAVAMALFAGALVAAMGYNLVWHFLGRYLNPRADLLRRLVPPSEDMSLRHQIPPLAERYPELRAYLWAVQQSGRELTVLDLDLMAAWVVKLNDADHKMDAEQAYRELHKADESATPAA